MYMWNLILFPFWSFVLRHERTRVSSRRHMENKWRSPLKSYLELEDCCFSSVAWRRNQNLMDIKSERIGTIASIYSKNTDLSDNVDVKESFLKESYVFKLNSKILKYTWEISRNTSLVVSLSIFSILTMQWVEALRSGASFRDCARVDFHLQHVCVRLQMYRNFTQVSLIIELTRPKLLDLPRF